MKLGILLTHEHRLLSVAAMLDVFQSANDMISKKSGAPFFDIRLLQPETSAAIAYQDFRTEAITVGERFDLLLVPAFKPEPMHTMLAANRVWIPWLQQQYGSGAHIASFCTGAFLLASTGLLDERPATTHINAEYAFSAAFPKVRMVADAVITEMDRVYTSGGATNSFHLMIHLVERFCDRETAIHIAKIFSIDIDRKSQAYFGTFAPIDNHGDELVKQAQRNIMRNFHEATTIEELIVDVPASRRNLVRRFKQATGITPIAYLQKTRIEAAKQSLEQSRLSISEVMADSGYNDLKSFRTLFKKNVGMTPTAYRDKFSPFVS